MEGVPRKAIVQCICTTLHQCFTVFQVQEYLKNLGTEYRFSCYYEKDPKGCHLLGDYLEAISRDEETAYKVWLKNCDERSHGHSCHKVAGYRVVWWSI